MLQDAPRAARERFGKPKNERRAAWERSSPKLVPQNDPPENTPNHLFYNVFCTFLEIHRSTHFVPKKMDHPKWTPKSAQGDRTKHTFLKLFLLFLFFGLVLVAAPGEACIFKICNITLVL